MDIIYIKGRRVIKNVRSENLCVSRNQRKWFFDIREQQQQDGQGEGQRGIQRSSIANEWPVNDIYTQINSWRWIEKKVLINIRDGTGKNDDDDVELICGSTVRDQRVFIRLYTRLVQVWLEKSTPIPPTTHRVPVRPIREKEKRLSPNSVHTHAGLYYYYTAG
jgi:hypothetical protein